MTLKITTAKSAKSPGRPHPDRPEVILASLIKRHLVSTLARHDGSATPRDWWVATALAVRDTIHERMIATQGAHNSKNVRRLYYFSLEYLMGRLFGNNLLATGLMETAEAALKSLGQDFEEIRETEADMGLGNGGLGRLAACFLDSLATLDYPALGYGIYYEYGLFKQAFEHGQQIEHPDNWIIFGSPWEVMRPEYIQEIRLFGRVVASPPAVLAISPLAVGTENTVPTVVSKVMRGPLSAPVPSVSAVPAASRAVKFTVLAGDAGLSRTKDWKLNFVNADVVGTAVCVTLIVSAPDRGCPAPSCKRPTVSVVPRALPTSENVPPPIVSNPVIFEAPSRRRPVRLLIATLSSRRVPPPMMTAPAVWAVSVALPRSSSGASPPSRSCSPPSASTV